MLEYQEVRATTLELCEGLTAEDMTVQAMPDASPSKWHLAHTTWFFERFLLQSWLPDYRVFNPLFDHLFNSYYETLGKPFTRPNRGLLTRPSLTEVLDYRRHVDRAMARLLDRDRAPFASLLTTGLHHEMQHQELLQTDILYLLAQNPAAPAVKPAREPSAAKGPALRFVGFDAELFTAGAPAPQTGFSYDCERPQQQVYLPAFALANRPVNNREWLDFIEDGGYRNPAFWLSDGWARVKQHRWESPLYWQRVDDQWHQYGLDGLRPLELEAPVCHISYFEADAFARWAGKRLPREHELERATPRQPESCANFLEARRFRPQAIAGDGLVQLYGDVWEWTQSAFGPYHGFTPEGGALAEYNGKFMSGQFVLRGGSCATPKAQMRPSYRNFFYPHQRWQFAGLRLAEDG